MGPKDEIYKWQWDGNSIDDIKAFASERNLSLIELVEDYFPEGWQAETVPSEFHGLIKGGIEPGKPGGQYGAKGYQHLMQILAIDAHGNALVQACAFCIYTGAEGYEIVERTKDDAFSMAEQYQAAFALPKPSKPMKMG